MCECGNKNFPFREKCNRRSCGKPKPAGAGAGAGDAKVGNTRETGDAAPAAPPVGLEAWLETKAGLKANKLTAAVKQVQHPLLRKNLSVIFDARTRIS